MRCRSERQWQGCHQMRHSCCRWKQDWCRRRWEQDWCRRDWEREQPSSCHRHCRQHQPPRQQRSRQRGCPFLCCWDLGRSSCRHGLPQQPPRQHSLQQGSLCRLWRHWPCRHCHPRSWARCSSCKQRAKGLLVLLLRGRLLGHPLAPSLDAGLNSVFAPRLA